GTGALYPRGREAQSPEGTSGKLAKSRKGVAKRGARGTRGFRASQLKEGKPGCRQLKAETQPSEAPENGAETLEVINLGGEAEAGELCVAGGLPPRRLRP